MHMAVIKWELEDEQRVEQGYLDRAEAERHYATNRRAVGEDKILPSLS